jgi:DNA-binding NarL/FixJ family response regulator
MHNNNHENRITIVLADDHTIVRQGIRRLLEDKQEFEVTGEAADGEEALKLLAELHPDVLVTDIRMPKKDGIEVVREAKECCPKTKVIVLSMYGSEAYVYSALRAGASGYVLKIRGVQDLDIAIQEVMRGKRFLSEPITEETVEAYRVRTKKPPLT